ncbi:MULTISPECIES: dihydrofolate reductase family protein [unclassified Nocardia]|uniref:dihydrofolate reductase family protein n=1 Tax=unclassified Nocardia TaxID=2637762 RepID=UPI0033ACF8CC
MGKLIESTFVTLDGSVDAPHEWSAPYWDDEHAAYASELLSAADGLLLGRETYAGFAQVWPTRPAGDPYTDRINALPKYVASTTLRPSELTWNAELLAGDTVESVREVKARTDGALLKFGTGAFSQLLLDNALVDEYHFWVFPVIAGAGTRLFDGKADTTHLKLLGTTRFDSGIVVHRLAPR